MYWVCALETPRFSHILSINDENGGAPQVHWKLTFFLLDSWGFYRLLDSACLNLVEKKLQMFPTHRSLDTHEPMDAASAVRW